MQKFSYTVSKIQMREQILNLTSQHSSFAVLDSCAPVSFVNIPGKYDLIAGLGIHKSVSVNQNALQQLQSFLEDKENVNHWKFGFLSYDLKNEIENLSSENRDAIQFPLLHFFVPEIVIVLKDDIVEIECYSNKTSAESVFQKIISSNKQTNNSNSNIEFELPSATDYCNIIEKIKYHLHRGDIYEMNYCIQLLQQCEIEPLNVYKRLTEYSPAPYSCFARINNQYLMSASPERFIAKEKTKIFSQPMKGTSKRSDSKGEDENLKQQLQQSEKERAENVMIVDLVRNDLSRIAKRGSVKVDELFSVYTFPRVHQMVSTISAELRDEINFTDIIKAMFPMGSMTGAPKVRAMQLIEEFENFNRGIFSGSVGYINPEGDFDFNVVIRSIIYNSQTKQLSIPVGSAITAKSDAMQEYNECILKAQGMLKALGMNETNSDIEK